MPRVTVPPATKAAAIADLLTGDQPAVVAARYGIPSSMVRKWKFRLGTPDGTQSVPATVPARPAIERAQLDIAHLVMDNLQAKLIAAQKIAEYATTTTWLEKQSAADVAELLRVLDQHALSVLDRISRHGSDDSSGDP